MLAARPRELECAPGGSRVCGPVTGCPRNTRRRQRTAGRKKKFCSPSAPSRFTLARPRVRRAASRFIGQLVAVNRQRSSQRPLLGAPTANRCHRTTYAQLDEPKTDDETSSCCVLNQQLLRVKREMARRRHRYCSNTKPIRIRLRGVLIQTRDPYGGHEKNKDVPHVKPTPQPRHRPAARALRRPLNAPLCMFTRMCGAAAGSYRPTQPTREPKSALCD